MQGHSGPGIDHLLQLLLHDSTFARSVQQQDCHGAATAAIGVVKAHLKAFTSALRPPGAQGSYAPSAAGIGGNGGDISPIFRRMSSDQLGRRTSDPGLPFRPDIRVRDRVVINTNHKKYEGNLIGKEGIVLSITQNGWVKLQVGSEVLDVQMRYLTPLHNRGGTAAGLASSGSLGAAGLKTPLDKPGALKGPRAGGPLRKADVVKLVRKELTQMEEQVPWKEVQGRWRTLRKTWIRRLRQADSTREIAICIREFHDNLKTDKTSGLFLTGGAWEMSLRECMTAGGSNPMQLLQVWDDMKAALQSWLAAGELPGGLASLDKASYEQAVHTYAVLQEAASKGPEYLEQVPLEQILTSQKEMSALQHIIQREAAAAHSRLQAIVLGADAAEPSVAAAAVAAPEFEGGISESMLLQLSKLPAIKTHEGVASDVDTDNDAGSEATDVEDDSDMDCY